MSSLRLYYDDSYIKEFTANVIEARPYDDGKYAVILDRTAFYPASGGQPSDAGWIDGIQLVDVTEDGSNVLHITSEMPKSAQVACRIDWTRRFDHMQQHSGQHILSAAAYQITGAETVGFHLGTTSSQVDLSLEALTREQAEAIEQLANEVVFANTMVSIHYATRSTLADYPIRKQPPTEVDRIRLIEFPSIDCCPCGGTHVKTSGEIGLIKIRAWERKKGLVRVDYVSGGRALKDYQLVTYTVNSLSARFSAPVPELFTTVEKHFVKDEQTEKHLNQLKHDLSDYIAKHLLNSAEVYKGIKLISHQLSAAQPQEIADLAKRLTSHGNFIALIGGVNPEQTKNHLVFACSPGIPVNMGELLRTVLPIVNGKGGGSAQSAQGGGTAVEGTALALAKAKSNVILAL